MGSTLLLLTCPVCQGEFRRHLNSIRRNKLRPPVCSRRCRYLRTEKKVRASYRSRGATLDLTLGKALTCLVCKRRCRNIGDLPLDRKPGDPPLCVVCASEAAQEKPDFVEDVTRTTSLAGFFEHAW